MVLFVGQSHQITTNSEYAQLITSDDNMSINADEIGIQKNTDILGFFSNGCFGYR